MSTSYRPLHPVTNSSLRGALPEMGLHIGRQEHDDDSYSISDGSAFLWVYPEIDGSVGFERFGANDVGEILETLSNYFQVEIIDEHDDRFWPEDDDDDIDSIDEATGFGL